MSRTQTTSEAKVQRRAPRRAADPVARNLGGAQAGPGPAAVFDLGSSGGSDIAKEKDTMIAEAFASASVKSPRHAFTVLR